MDHINKRTLNDHSIKHQKYYDGLNIWKLKLQIKVFENKIM
jgi:hypothetical protein